MKGTDTALRDALAALAAETAAARAPERVERALLAEYRRRRYGWRARLLAGAVAAALLVITSIAMLRGGRPARPAAKAELARGASTGFIPVAYAEPLRPEESARILRVRMPRAALATFGLPVNEDRLDEHIQAEVLVGDDNLVRAVRFQQ